MIRKRALWFGVVVALAAAVSSPLVMGQDAGLKFLNGNRPMVDAHNCYPYEGRWSNRVERALNSGFPVSIEQDLSWYVDPSTGKGRVVVTHSTHPDATAPSLEDYFFKQVQPVIEKAIEENKKSEWPLVILHFDFKVTDPPILHAVWQLLQQHRSWISTAVKTDDPNRLSPVERRPVLVVTEDSDAQEKVFFDDVPVGQELLLFGSAHTTQPPPGMSKAQVAHWEVTTSPSKLLTTKPTNYRRWWNLSWDPVEEGGQQHAGAWTAKDNARLRSLVDYAHQRGYWIRFYTLDGFSPEEDQGWFAGYNFGSRAAVIPRWKAAIAAGVNFVATDQYEELARYMQQDAKNLRPSATKNAMARRGASFKPTARSTGGS